MSTPQSFPMKVHNHPQKTEYASADEWPWASPQRHWLAPGFASPAHTHIELKVPAYGEITGPFPLAGRLVLHDTAGTVGSVWNLEHQVKDVIWEATGSAELPLMQGDPNGDKFWNFSCTFDPWVNDGAGDRPLHGEFLLKMFVRTIFTNGDFSTDGLFFPAFMALDTTAPESPASSAGRRLSSYATTINMRRPDLSAFGSQAGDQIAEYVSPIPIAPISKPWPVDCRFFNYEMLQGYTGPFRFPDGTFEMRIDPDLHHGIPGTIVAHGQLPSLSEQVQHLVIDPAVMGAGEHKVMILWLQPDGQGNDATAVLVIKVTVGPEIPPPPPSLTCQDPKAINIGSPLPCIYATPPTEEKRAAGGLFQQFIGGVAQPHFFVKDAGGAFIEVGLKP